ncbi:MAG: TetR/AcrR family transcriptional regulator [Candidatus Thorarchaeota archaeon]|jgi:AcrR family transcriptional regulator
MEKGEKKFTRDKETKIETIITSMTEIIREKGLHKASVRDIPERAGLSIGTVYRYFPKGKVDIVREMMRRNIQGTLDLDVPDDLDQSGFMRVWSHMIDVAIEVRRSNLFVEGLADPLLSAGHETYREFTNMVLRFYNDLARRFKRVDHLKDCSEAELFRRIVATLNIIDRVANIHVKFPLFADDRELAEYLLRVVEITFEACK